MQSTLPWGRRPESLAGRAALAASLLVGALAACTAPEQVSAAANHLEDADASEPYVFVTEQAALEIVERSGHALSDALGGGGHTGDVLFETSAGYRSLHDWIGADIAWAIGEHEKAGRTPVGFGDARGSGLTRYTYRTFNPDWLKSPDVHFELIGVALRLDRRDVPSRRATCGETRLVYRMAYDGQREASRLPLTLLVELEPAGAPDCQAVAKRWMGPPNLHGEQLARFLLDGPLNGLGELMAVELNYETVRWPSSVRDDFAGQDEYVLRVFRPAEGGALEPVKLENTPDSAAINADPTKRERLRRWIEDNAEAIADGSAILDEDLLADAVRSVATRGLARRVNRPFSQIFSPEELGGDAPRKLLRRLDTMTCNGCHQARSFVGFHLLGEERIPEDDTSTFVNALAVGTSPHLVDEIARRKADLLKFLANGTKPLPRPFVERAGPGVYGSKCGLSDELADWTCDEPGLRCLDTDGDEVGTCQPEQPSAGDAVELVRVTVSDDPFLDRAVDRRMLACAPGAVSSGRGQVRGVDAFPGGACLGSCSEDERGRNVGPNLVCSDIPFGARFDQCFGFSSFADCMAETVKPTVLRACDVEHPCRDDYVCARVANRPAHGRIADEAGGACVPPYALIQMEVDTHLIR